MISPLKTNKLDINDVHMFITLLVIHMSSHFFGGMPAFIMIVNQIMFAPESPPFVSPNQLHAYDRKVSSILLLMLYLIIRVSLTISIITLLYFYYIPEVLKTSLRYSSMLNCWGSESGLDIYSESVIICLWITTCSKVLQLSPPSGIVAIH